MPSMNKAASHGFTLASHPLAGEGGPSLATGLEAWFGAAGAWQREAADFVHIRLEKDRNAWNAILASRDMAHVADIQSRWVEETFRDYFTQMARMMTLGTTIATGGRRP